MANDIHIYKYVDSCTYISNLKRGCHRESKKERERERLVEREKAKACAIRTRMSIARTCICINACTYVCIYLYVWLRCGRESGRDSVRGVETNAAAAAAMFLHLYSECLIKRTLAFYIFI